MEEREVRHPSFSLLLPFFHFWHWLYQDGHRAVPPRGGCSSLAPAPRLPVGYALPAVLDQGCLDLSLVSLTLLSPLSRILPFSYLQLCPVLAVSFLPRFGSPLPRRLSRVPQTDPVLARSRHNLARASPCPLMPLGSSTWAPVLEGSELLASRSPAWLPVGLQRKDWGYCTMRSHGALGSGGMP